MRSMALAFSGAFLLAACGSAEMSDDAGDGATDARDVARVDGTGLADTPGIDALDAFVDDVPVTDGTTVTDVPTTDTPSTDAAPSCPFPPTGAADPLAAMRTGCHFASGAHVADTLGLQACARAQIPIRHIIVLTQENRSFDHYITGMGLPGVEPIPASYTNVTTGTGTTRPSHANTTCVSPDVSHSWGSTHNEWDNGRMDGFYHDGAASGAGQRALFYYTPADLPFYHWLYGTFATSDRYFCSALGPTWPNRQYMWTATSAGNKETGGTVDHATSIFDRLTAAHVTWGVYVDGSPLEDCLGWSASHTGVHNTALFRTQAHDGTLPQVSFIDGHTAGQWEHPAADIAPVEGWVRSTYLAVQQGAGWGSTVMFLTYDEGGGFFDHVAPPAACVPDHAANNADFNRLGIRVPIAVISPYVKPHYVSHVTHSHTSITRFIEAVFDLPALTARDANSDAMLDMFDFGTPALMAPGTPPAAGASHCSH